MQSSHASTAVPRALPSPCVNVDAETPASRPSSLFASPSPSAPHARARARRQLWPTEQAPCCRCRSHCYALSPPQSTVSSSSPAHAAPNTPLPWSTRSPERPAVGDVAGWSVGVRGWATLSHHGRSHEPHQLCLVVLHPMRALATGQRRRRAGAASTAVGEPLLRVAPPPRVTSRRAVATHGCASASSCFSSTSPRPSASRRPTFPLAGAPSPAWPSVRKKKGASV
jgi:hypothetical protein